MNFSVENILDMISSYGEEGLQSDLAAFDCPQNIEIETFIRNKAIDFAKPSLILSPTLPMEKLLDTLL